MFSYLRTDRNKNVFRYSYKRIEKGGQTERVRIAIRVACAMERFWALRRTRHFNVTACSRVPRAHCSSHESPQTVPIQM